MRRSMMGGVLQGRRAVGVVTAKHWQTNIRLRQANTRLQLHVPD